MRPAGATREVVLHGIIPGRPVRGWMTEAQLSAWEADANRQIAPMTNPLGRSWTAPSRLSVAVLNQTACVSSRDFSRLLEYSHSQPTGVYVGKMWRRVIRERRIDEDAEWIGYKRHRSVLCWYGHSCLPNTVANLYRELRVLDEER